MPGTVNLADDDARGAMSAQLPRARTARNAGQRPAARHRQQAPVRSCRRSAWRPACRRARRPSACRGRWRRPRRRTTRRVRRRTSPCRRWPRRPPRNSALTWATWASSPRSGSGGTPAPSALHRAACTAPRAAPPAAPAPTTASMPDCRLRPHVGVPRRRPERQPACRRPARGRTRPTPRARPGRSRRRRRSPTRPTRSAHPAQLANELSKLVRGAAHPTGVVDAAAVEPTVGDRERRPDAVGQVDRQRVGLRVTDDRDPAGRPVAPRSPARRARRTPAAVAAGATGVAGASNVASAPPAARSNGSTAT